jgi:hypothetical protein
MKRLRLLGWHMFYQAPPRVWLESIATSPCAFNPTGISSNDGDVCAISGCVCVCVWWVDGDDPIERTH